MRRETAHDERMARLFATQDGRLQGSGAWQKYPFFWFLLFLSYRCTRRCSYCYAFNQVGFDNEQEMDDRTFSRLLDWIPEVWRANNVKLNTVVFLGGEPLLWTGRIRKVMDAVNRATGGVQGNLNTNGDLVDAVCWDDLEEIQWITTNVTDVEIPELARRLRVVADRSNVLGQTIAATLDDHNLERIVDVSRFGIESGYRLRYNRDLFRGTDAPYKARLLAKYHELCDLFEDYLARGYDVRTTFLFDSLIPSWDLETSPYHCGRRSATVYPDGSVGPCIRNQAYKTATIFDDDPFGRLQCSTFHMDLHDGDLPGECRECESADVCQGGCPNDKLLLTGTRAGKSVMCDVHREIIPRLKALGRRRGVAPSFTQKRWSSQDFARSG